MIAEKGVVPPENIGMNEKLYSGFVKEMGKRGVKIQETIVQD
jgi:hypothetical protein